MAGCGGTILRALLFAFFCSAPARAEFPPETFPDDPSQPENSQSYEESESQAAEDEYLSPKKRRLPPKPKRKTRRDGVVRQPIPEEALPDEAFVSRFRLGVLGGLSTLSSDSATQEALIGQIFVKDHMALGAMMDYTFTRNISADLEGFYAFTPLQEVEYPGNVIETRQMKNWGIFAGGSFGYPIFRGDMVFTPRLGLGFALLSFKQFLGKTAGNAEQTLSLYGFYASLGMEARFGKKLSAFVDYAISVGAKGSIASVGGTAGNANIPGPSFSRFRLGATYRVWNTLAIGPLIVMRGAKDAVFSDGPLGQGDRLFQILGLATIDF